MIPASTRLGIRVSRRTRPNLLITADAFCPPFYSAHDTSCVDRRSLKTIGTINRLMLASREYLFSELLFFRKKPMGILRLILPFAQMAEAVVVIAVTLLEMWLKH